MPRWGAEWPPACGCGWRDWPGPIVADGNYQNISEIIAGWNYPPSYALHVYMLSPSDALSKIKVGPSWLTEGEGT